MYDTSENSRKASASDLVSALEVVADAVRRKKYHLPSGEEKPDYFRIELHLSVRECRDIMRLVDDLKFKQILSSATRF